ncbi:hypothetical protein DSL72_007567 [Monilinia vaccinii-corymbosi]|uniref:Uncharacterized protein n=1 Tax=Monilinia vaccinii-corymbosi TaxID=61207 RepID=A0A8A3PHF5_9HELO|nr:hypothetical protein DSL72_007567 [Monilinia vaccinii-corymbosi]
MAMRLPRPKRKRKRKRKRNASCKDPSTLQFTNWLPYAEKDSTAMAMPKGQESLLNIENSRLMLCGPWQFDQGVICAAEEGSMFNVVQC